MGVGVGTEMEQIRRKLDIPIFVVCTAMNIDNDLEYHRIANGHATPTVYQLFMFIELSKTSMDSVFNQLKYKLKEPTDAE